jgi:hypothetical protein
MSKRRRGSSKKPKRASNRHPTANKPTQVEPPGPGGTRRSRRIVRHIDTRSVLKFSAFFYLTLACIAFVAGVVLWLVATVVGVRGNVERFIGELIASNKFHFVGWEVLRVSAVAAVVMVILGTALNLFLAVVYNLIAEIVGGMAIIVDDEPLVTVAGPTLPASEVAGRRAVARPQDPGTLLRPAAATAANPDQADDDPRAIARWVPKRGRQV